MCLKSLKIMSQCKKPLIVMFVRFNQKEIYLTCYLYKVHSSLFHPSVHEQGPISAPVSPSSLRRISSQAEDDQPKANLRSGRRKLGSRHGWALGRGRGGISQSFSPGDQRVQPRIRLRSSQTGAMALWEHDGSPTPSQDSPSEEGRGKKSKDIN